MKKRIALFPGTFDPFTVGHESVVNRTLKFMDEVIIGIGVNERKRALFSVRDRKHMIEELYKDEPRVKVMAYDHLTMDFAKEQNADFIVRGIRSVKDFEYEETIADINRQISGVETLLLYTEAQLTSVSSSVVRELYSYGKDVSRFLPKGLTLPAHKKKEKKG
ncbi:MAG: pantetheine-phosphate adenylyltransferase [Bacteroidaceae bacterium]|nr:pantetheine-phosphate adenylyltransferase [Bacteroidaceae bacterium]MCF0185914.1 pantetheine-phosphate adenylyltransferase [Bacteroidaceae bacterium]